MILRAVAGLLAANFFDQNFSSILNGIALGMLIFILAVGLSLIFGLLDVLNLAHGSLYLLGTYFGYELVERRGAAVHPAALASRSSSASLLGPRARALRCGRSAAAATSTRCS